MGLAKNLQQAENYYAPAAVGEHKKAQYAISRLYADGGVTLRKSYTKRMKWLQCSAESGYEIAQKELQLLTGSSTTAGLATYA